MTFGVDHIVSGVAINLLAAGAVRFLSELLYAGVPGGGPTQSPSIKGGTPTFDVPVLASGPDLLGRLEQTHRFVLSDVAGLLRGLLHHVNVFQVIGVLLFPLVGFVLWRTAFGLRLRSVRGEPVGGRVARRQRLRYKYVAVLASGALAGLGGLFLVCSTGLYKEGQTGGRGYIGLAAMIFGNWRPGGLLAGALLFGYTDAIRLRDRPTAVLALLLFARDRCRRARRSGGCARAGGGRARHRPRRRVPAGYLGPTSCLTSVTTVTPYVVTLLVLPSPRRRCGRPRPTACPTAAARSRDGGSDAVDWDLAARRGRSRRWSAPTRRTRSFPVGVAGLVDDGRVVTGCNVENAAYGVALCAECGMVSQLHVTGGGRLVAVACVDGDGDALMACGRCRQLLWENGGPDCLVMTPSGGIGP